MLPLVEVRIDHLNEYAVVQFGEEVESRPYRPGCSEITLARSCAESFLFEKIQEGLALRGPFKLVPCSLPDGKIGFAIDS